MVIHRQHGNPTLIVSLGMWQHMSEMQSTLSFHVLTYTRQIVNLCGISDP